MHADFTQFQSAFYEWVQRDAERQEANRSQVTQAIQRLTERLEESDRQFARIRKTLTEAEAPNQTLVDVVTALLIDVHVLRTPETRRTLTGVRVLVLDDNESLRAALVTLCRGYGAGCIAAASVVEAREHIEQQTPDLITLDLSLGDGRDGMAFVRELRTTRPELGIVVVTGRITELQHREARMLGIDILEKPFHVDALIRAIRQARRQR